MIHALLDAAIPTPPEHPLVGSMRCSLVLAADQTHRQTTKIDAKPDGDVSQAFAPSPVSDNSLLVPVHLAPPATLRSPFAVVGLSLLDQSGPPRQARDATPQLSTLSACYKSLQISTPFFTGSPARLPVCCEQLRTAGGHADRQPSCLFITPAHPRFLSRLPLPLSDGGAVALCAGWKESDGPDARAPAFTREELTIEPRLCRY